MRAGGGKRLADLEMFGSWEDKHFGPVYMVSAQCSTGCHVMTRMITPEALDWFLDTDIIWADTERHIREAFAEVHG